MQIFVRVGDETQVVSAQSVADLKAALPLDDETQYFSCGGQVVSDDFELSENCTLELQARLPGGKVHGSLARAGKVRNQTPKVEKNTENARKKLSGRARRRQQYTKRFINVVVGPGRKRGPNSNAK